MKRLFENNKENSLKGKWIHLGDIEPLLKINKNKFTINEIGKSFLNKSIYSITLGNGPIKIFMWTQMHGNEATATKVIFDLINVFKSKSTPAFFKKILKNCTIKIIPILNPDGALAYTRVNAQQIDLNRDAVNLNAPESRLLRKTLTEFKPHYCFNLHDQRNLYSVAQTGNPASISFLSPATEVTRKLTPERIKAMSVICNMFNAVKDDLPDCVSRYNDEFYPNATGDNFQKDGYCTILIEAGHIKDDFDREEVRYYYFKTLIKGLLSIVNQIDIDYNIYGKIPENTTNYLDIIYKNVMINENDSYKNISIGILFIEEIHQNKIKKIPTITQYGNLSNYNADTIIDAQNMKIKIINEFLTKI